MLTASDLDGGGVVAEGELSGPEVDNRVGYAGYRWDPYVKLYHVRHRVYRPDLGLWLQPDPAGYVDGMNLYAYCGNRLFLMAVRPNWQPVRVPECQKLHRFAHRPLKFPLRSAEHLACLCLRHPHAPRTPPSPFPLSARQKGPGLTIGSNVPANRDALLAWCEGHYPVWGTLPASIGLSQSQTTAFKNKTMAARAASAASDSAKQTARSATLTLNDALADLSRDANDLVRAIKAYAGTSGDGGVYAAADISPPSPPGPLPAPAQPTDFAVGLNPDGSLTLRWRATQPRGSSHTVYLVKRKLNAETAYTLIDTVGEKSFTDTTIPRGSDGAMYTVQSKRGNDRGPDSLPVGVQFGSAVGGGGGGGGTGFAITGATNVSGQDDARARRAA